MKEKEILEKYGDTRCEFYSYYKHRICYIDVDGKFTIHGQGYYRSDLEKIMSVIELWQEFEEGTLKFTKE